MGRPPRAAPSVSEIWFADAESLAGNFTERDFLPGMPNGAGHFGSDLVETNLEVRDKIILVMRNLFACLVISFAVPIAWSGDYFQVPKLRDSTGYDSTDPKYRMIGIEVRSEKSILWVVADPDAVTIQKKVNRIIQDIRHRLKATRGKPGFDEIWFFSSVSSKPQFPAFCISDHLAVYSRTENKTRFGPAAKGHNGGWVFGPNP